MNIYIYSDESGVLDKVHNKYYVFGGLIILGSESKEEWSRRYSAVEKILRAKKKVPKQFELKATNITNGEKGKLFRSLNNCFKFGAVVRQEKVLDNIFHSKKDKQRYLDFVYKLAVKKALEKLILDKLISPDKVERIYFYVDEHTTATNGLYELKEGLEQEFKIGTYNYNYRIFYPPIFTKLKDVQLQYCNSNSKLLVRAADIVANKIYYIANQDSNYNNISNLHITYFP
ncbi:MAG: DUF3800 domain-containing protein [Zhenhengia sp.]|uniref:DUF3800 domain-containing protein n=1 Tax=Zhenhengia sp. TaxID=2944208 RepID=UPI0039913DF9